MLFLISLFAVLLGPSQTRKLNPLLCLKTNYRLILGDKLQLNVSGVGFTSRSEYDYGVIYGFSENKNQVLLQLSSAQADIIPKRCFKSEQLLRLKAIMLKRLGPAKCKKIKF